MMELQKNIYTLYANKYDKPIVIHVRDPQNDAYTIFKEHKHLIKGGSNALLWWF